MSFHDARSWIIICKPALFPNRFSFPKSLAKNKIKVWRIHLSTSEWEKQVSSSDNSLQALLLMTPSITIYTLYVLFFHLCHLELQYVLEISRRTTSCCFYYFKSFLIQFGMLISSTIFLAMLFHRERPIIIVLLNHAGRTTRF